jgi:hypothetical protein
VKCAVKFLECVEKLSPKESLLFLFYKPNHLATFWRDEARLSSFILLAKGLNYLKAWKLYVLGLVNK